LQTRVIFSEDAHYSMRNSILNRLVSYRLRFEDMVATVEEMVKFDILGTKFWNSICRERSPLSLWEINIWLTYIICFYQ